MPRTLLTSIPFLHGCPSPLILTGPSLSASPFELYAKIASARHPSFLFESGNGEGAMGRYSYFGVDPYQTLYGKGHTFVCRSIQGRMDSWASPFQGLAHLMNRQRIARPADVPPFFGGAVGYLSYDLVRRFERLPSLALDDLGVPDLEFAFFDLVAAIDHELNRLMLMFCPPLERFLGEPREKLFREGKDRLAEFEARLARPDRADAHWRNLGRLTFAPEQEQAAYSRNVGRCQEYIAAGDVYQVNLSHRFTVTSEAFSSLGDLQTDLATYGRLRALNPSPFSGLLPIAGTRPRGKTPFDDRRLIEELLTSEKERAEHVMLVDLERNDLGRVCRFGTVHVSELMTVEQYSHVNHLVSQVAGTLKDHATGFDLLEAMFPGGTITGVPKIRCMEIIEELEPVRRGPYTGSMGYLSWSGELDFNILIRTLVMRHAVGYLQVGAGIVADSEPTREYEETIHKAQAFFSAFL
jgi:para-aminobenzoate synthetase component 1